MSSPGERAAQRLNQFAADHGDAVQLARLASLAVRIDAPLLRALRLRFLRGSDACIEADLWFSPLTESMSSQGLVLSPQVAEILRSDLAADTVDGAPVLLDAAAGLIDDAHRDWPPSLRMEERITWLSLKGDPASLGEVDALLRQAAKAMVEDNERGMEIARWALRALPRLPAAARASEAALLLALGASGRLGGRVVLAGDAQRASALPEAAWILPAGSLARRTTIGLRRLQDGIEFIDADGAPLTLELPQTTPLVVELRWSENGADSAITLGVQPGRQVLIPTGASGVRIRTLAGDEYALEDAPVEGEVPPPRYDSSQLQAAVVRVRFQGPALTPADATGLDLAGFFVVARDLVLTLAGGESPRMDEGLRAGSWTIEQHGKPVSATAVAIAGAIVLLRLPSPIPGAVVLERNWDPVTIEPGRRWESVRLDDDGTLSSVHGRIVSITQNSLLTLRAVGVASAMLELETDHPVGSTIRQPAPPAGAPVLVDGQVIGLIAGTTRPPARPNVASNVVSTAPSSPRLLAVPADRLNDFLYRSLRPAEHEPTVVVVCAADPRPAPAALDRLQNALRAARVRPWLDTENISPGSAFDPQFVAAVNDSEGAAIVLASEIPRGSRHEQFQLQMIAYRRWAKPDYPVAIFGDSRGPDIRKQRFGRLMKMIGPPQSGPAPNIEAASDAELAAHATRAFERLGRLRDAASGEEGVMQWLATLVSEPSATEKASEQQAMKEAGSPVDAGLRAIRRDGLFADIDWQGWLQGGLYAEPEIAGRELVDIAAMFTLPAETAQRVRAAATAPRGQRALCLSAMPVSIARTLIRRAWIGEAAPVSLVFREQDWPSLGRSADAPHVVAATVGRAIEGDEETVKRLLQEIATPVFLIFATRPLPPRPYLDTLQQMLPHAVLFFLCGEQRPDSSLLDGSALTELPPLEAGVAGFIGRYKELMQLAVPRNARGSVPGSGPRQAARRRPKAVMPKKMMTT